MFLYPYLVEVSTISWLASFTCLKTHSNNMKSCFYKIQNKEYTPLFHIKIQVAGEKKKKIKLYLKLKSLYRNEVSWSEVPPGKWEYLVTSVSLQHKYLKRIESKLVYLCIPNTQHDSDTKRLLTLMNWINTSWFQGAHSPVGRGNVIKGYFNQWVLANKEKEWQMDYWKDPRQGDLGTKPI